VLHRPWNLRAAVSVMKCFGAFRKCSDQRTNLPTGVGRLKESWLAMSDSSPLVAVLLSARNGERLIVSPSHATYLLFFFYILSAHISCAERFHWHLHMCLQYILFFVYLFIYSYVHTLFGPSLPPAPGPFSLPPTCLTSRQNLSCPLLQFCWREDISDNKKDIAFLLVWR
jgi:hypothetical protein